MNRLHVTIFQEEEIALNLVARSLSKSDVKNSKPIGCDSTEIDLLLE